MFVASFAVFQKEVQDLKNEMDRNSQRISQLEASLSEGGQPPADLRMKFSPPQLPKVMGEDKILQLKTKESDTWLKAVREIMESRLQAFQELQNVLNNRFLNYSNFQYLYSRLKEIHTRLNDVDLSNDQNNEYVEQAEIEFEKFLFKMKTKKPGQASILRQDPHRPQANVAAMEVQPTIESRLSKLEGENESLRQTLKNLKGVKVASALGSADSIGSTRKQKGNSFNAKQQGSAKSTSQKTPKEVPKIATGNQGKGKSNQKKGSSKN